MSAFSATKLEPVLIGLYVRLCFLYGNGKSTDGYARFDPCHAGNCVLSHVSVLCKC